MSIRVALSSLLTRRSTGQIVHLPAFRRRGEGRLLRALRKERGLTQAALAELIGVSQAIVSAWETGRVQITPARKRQLIKALKEDPWE